MSAAAYVRLEQHRHEWGGRRCRLPPLGAHPPPPSSSPLIGPRDTPFDSGIFYVNIELDDQYPFVPPKMRFITKVRLQLLTVGAAAVVC
jgi:hypothetical protein